MGNMIPEPGTKSCHQYDIYLMDVSLIRSSEPAIRGATVDPNIVFPLRGCFPKRPGGDFKY
jgi:hypothetical protein